MTSSDRFFAVAILGGRVRVCGIPDWGPWDNNATIGPVRLVAPFQWLRAAIVWVRGEWDSGRDSAITEQKLKARTKRLLQSPGEA